MLTVKTIDGATKTYEGLSIFTYPENSYIVQVDKYQYDYIVRGVLVTKRIGFNPNLIHSFLSRTSKGNLDLTNALTEVVKKWVF